MANIMKTTAEFKKEITDIVRSMPLKEILFVPDSFVEGAISAWLEVDPEKGVSIAQEEYRKYYHMITSLPDEQVIMDIDLYMFRVARKIIDGLMISMLDVRYYDNIFGHANLSPEDTQYFVDLTNDVINRIETQIEVDSFLDKHASGKTAKELRDEFNKRCKGILEDDKE
jgi:hypothetical protein